MARDEKKDEVTVPFLSPAEKATADLAAAEKADTEKKAAAQKALVGKELAEFKVADGFHITCLRGVLAPGESVTARDFNDGQKAIDDLAGREPPVIVRA